MLELQHISIEDKDGHLLLEDVSFSLSNHGFISMHGEDERLLSSLAQVLAGIKKPNTGTIQYNDRSLQTFSEEERSLYRSVFASSLFNDFQIIKNMSVFENITMGLEYPEEKIEHEIAHWHLLEKINVLVEDLSFEDQVRMVLLRIMIRKPSLIVFHKGSCPFSQQELDILYTLLEVISEQILVIVIGDQHSYAYATRTIEFAKGFIVSDSLRQEQEFQQVTHGFTSFQLTRNQWDDIGEHLHYVLRWKLRCLSVLGIIMFICLSAAIFSTTLNIEDIEMGILKDQNLSLFTIEKQAKGKDDTIYDRHYTTMQQEDIEILQQNLKGNITLGYYPTYEKQATYFVYGSVFTNHNKGTLNEATIIEAESGEDLGLKTIVGEYPRHYHEVALSSQAAYTLLGLEEPYQNTEEQYQKMLGSQVLWYEEVMTISGIFPEESSNKNLEFHVAGYSGYADTDGTLNENSMYVKKGFVDQFPVLTQQVYQKSYKRILQGNNITDFDNLTALDRKMIYYDGSEIQNNKKLHKDEVLVDFQMALVLGYRSIYMDTMANENLNELDRQQRYEEFADQWIGKTITIQTYSIDGAASNSTIMNKQVKIKGFILPTSFSYVTYYVQGKDQGGIYMNPSVIEPYATQNSDIQEVYFQSDSEEDLRSALLYLRKSGQYAAFLSSSTILQFFVVDLKNLTTFLLIAGGSSFLVFAWLLQHLLCTAIAQLRKEMSIYYLFGERKKVLIQMYKHYFTDILKHQVLFGWLCGTLALGTFVLMIYFLLSATPSVLYSLVLPLVLAFLVFIIMKIVFILTLRKQDIIEESFEDE